MPAEERKLATVLFADLVGSTELAADEDAERVRALLDRFYDSMAAEIDRVGGTVEKFVRVMAAFGAPAAHEDDAGLRLVDPHDWSFRTIDPHVFDLASGQVVGTASTPVWSLLIDAAAPPAG